MTAPFEIIAAPFEAYVAPVGESFPAVTLEPPVGNWVLIGTLGDTNYGEEGVTVQHSETVEDFRSLGSTGPVKSFRTEEDLLISFMLHDLTLEEYSRALNFGTVTTSSDDKLLPMYQGQDVAYRALLVRGNNAGPYGAYNIQFEIPRVREDSAPEVVFTKGIPAGLALSFRAMIDLSAATDGARFGNIRTQFQN